MTLAPGTRLGSYEVLSSLGEGGMGEVFRARDIRLGRDVAIKVILEAFVADRDRLLRFEREAKVLAALNHPNIATLHGWEEADGRHFLVMELVPGRTLGEAIRGKFEGQSPTFDVSWAVSIAFQMAEALEAAHEKGVVHRDLKPANVRITPDDKVKVLDFGLAKVSATDASDAIAGGSTAMANSPTLTAMGTQAGMILGTASYMSPEQARGMSGDHRSDVFSYGVVLYEMLTGRQPFQGDTVSDVLASVLAREPNLDALPHDVSPRLKELVARCLEKHPKRRWQAIGDVRHELEVIAKNPRWSNEPLPTGSLDQRAQAGTPAQPLWRRVLVPLGALVLGIVATAAAFMSSRQAPTPPEPITFEILPPSAAPVMSLSPDGRHVVFGTSPVDNEPGRLWIRPLASMDARPLAGTNGTLIRRGSWIGHVPWSPDSRSIAFATSTGSLHKLDVTSGQLSSLIKELGPTTVVVPGAWNSDGTILYGQRNSVDGRGAGIWRISASGGTPVQITELEPGDLAHRPSGFLPDGHRFLYIAYPNNLGPENQIRIGSIERQPGEQDKTTLFTADGAAVYASSGYLLFVRGGSLMSQAFDAGRGVLTGSPPIQIASGIGPTVLASNDGTLLYRLIGAEERPRAEILRLSRNGTILAKIGPAANYGDVNALADGRIAVSRSESGEIAGHLYIVDQRGAFTRLNPGTPNDFAAAVALDNLIAFTFSPSGQSKDLYVREANGVGDARPLVVSPHTKHANSWTPDGQFLVYDEHVPTRSQDLLMVARAGGAPVTLLATEWDETFAMVSPDGKWLAYRSTESGRPEVYVRDFDPGRTPALGSQKLPISVSGGDKPRWRHDGREIFYFQGESLMAVSMTPEGGSLKAGVPVKLFDRRYVSYIPYDVMRDDTFVMNGLVGTAAADAPTPHRVLLNWEAFLRK
jgi:serine/threonine protein kinase/Tol biopolymer transport system component